MKENNIQICVLTVHCISWVIVSPPFSQTFIVWGRGIGGGGLRLVDGDVPGVQTGEGEAPLPHPPHGLQLVPGQTQLLCQLLAPDSKWSHLVLSFESHLFQINV